MVCRAGCRYWRVGDGLPTSEVQQIVRLPNGQMLLNCEGVYCISNGKSFDVVNFDRSRVFQLRNYVNTYGQLWQGDSLLWLHDLYCLYLYDARTRSFRYDIAPHLHSSELRQFMLGTAGSPCLTGRQRRIIDSLGIRDCNAVAEDWQGGTWIGTRTDGVVYLPPPRYQAKMVLGNSPMISTARSTVDRSGNVWHCKGDGLLCETPQGIVRYGRDNVAELPYDKTTFIAQLPDSRYLLCDSLCHLGYFLPSQHIFVPLSTRLTSLRRYRHFVGACPVTHRLTAVYTQNGIFMLDIMTDTLLPFPHSSYIERYSSKYNCMLRDGAGRLWVGTQDGLFCLTPRRTAKGKDAEYSYQRVAGLANNCIRSLVTDAKGRVWAGTSCGISRVTPTVVNLGTEDGVPPISMMERSTSLLPDGRLVFVCNSSSAVVFLPDSLISHGTPLPVVLTSLTINGDSVAVPTPASTVTLPYTHNYLTFHFSTLDYANPTHTRYRCRLRGLETEWEVDGNANGSMAATYTALPPGEYVFEAQAASTDGKWGKALECRVTILPPPWLSWWAKMIYLAIVLTATACLLHIYLRAKRRKMERENDERVNRLFELRQEARHHFAQSTSIAPGKLSATTEEEALVAQLLKAIEAKMAEEDYGVDLLARDVNMSRANLYKKLQTMLGVTPADFIRNVRLKHAAKLLADTTLPVSEVATKSGFATARNFSSNFKRMFGVTPSEYRAAKA